MSGEQLAKERENLNKMSLAELAEELKKALQDLDNDPIIQLLKGKGGKE